MFLAPNFLGGELPEFLESIYKIDTGSDHVAKFRGDRPRKLGDLAAKKIKKNITSKIEDLPFYRTGGLTMIVCETVIVVSVGHYMAVKYATEIQSKISL